MRLPVIQRCVVIGWVGVGTIAAAVTVVGVISDYALADVFQAALFGMFEAFILVGFAGGVVGLLVGMCLHLAVRARRRHDAKRP